ncbi:glutamate--tRNA ligase [Candidatus Aminicenantes bacterium AC-335-K20]|nr:glutamate--tRNA ligase [Candidatus Aminicenantes bacterium AC-335-K20]
MKEIRVRFAPSPTGYLHVGGARTALFNWLFARKHNGKFILRIEDTDLARSSEEMTKGILEGMRWLGLDWDEGPYYQSKRIKIYQEYAERLIREGKAYYCYCTPEEIQERKNKAVADGKYWKYDRYCLNLTPEQRKALEKERKQRAIRFFVPDGKTTFRDLIHGEITFEHENIEDFVLLRRDGMPTYHLSVVVDDYETGITHVIRGDDHLSNTPKQILLYKALGAPIPKFAHLALILGPDRKKLKEIDEETKELIREWDVHSVTDLIKEEVNRVRKGYQHPKIKEYLDEVESNLIKDIDLFRGTPKEKFELKEEDPFIPYRVNLLVDNSQTKGAPVIIETNPTYINLFGTIEIAYSRTGAWKTDFTKIKAGSLLRANGGYLVFYAMDALLEPGVWTTLKRTLRNQVIEIQAYNPGVLITGTALKPEPIKADVKVVLIGDEYIYQLLYHVDEDFKKIFKVKAEFDYQMPKEKKTIYQYCSFLKKICEDEKLLPFDKTAVAALIEYGVRLAGRQNKLSTRFNIIADVIREADYWARKEKKKIVRESHVKKAIYERFERVSLIEDKIQELIEEGTIMIDTEGEVVGQVNGLSIYQIGEFMFGKPTRITAKTSIGRSGIISIEREAALSGRTHDKGVLILTGYLRSKYAQDKPLTVTASICFEQSYSGVDGDSASSTEVYAILSSLSGLPLRQDIAVTGSLNQKGEIQPIGGVNEKIEGFFDVCKAKGLTGTQGVIIPEKNVKDLMLRDDVIQAVKEGKFHIYPIKTIDEGIEILTGVKAGKRKPDGTFEKGTVNYLVDKTLREFAEQWKEFTGGEIPE